MQESSPDSASWQLEYRNAIIEWDQVEIEIAERQEAGGVLPFQRPSNDNKSGDEFAACSFQSIWSRLADRDLSKEKAAAKELIDAEEKLCQHKTATRITLFTCRFARRNALALQCTTLADERLLIVALCKVPYSNADPLHWELLSSVYLFFTEEPSAFTKKVARYGNHWQTIGFQGDDPATDLRGVGIFGLCQLLFLISNGLSSQMAIQLVELSRDKVQNFPLAVVGLNWTAMIMERLRKGKLNGLAMKENSFISVVNGIYRGCFLLFMRTWTMRKCTIGDFGAVSNEIKETVKRRPKYLLNMAILSGP